jgi:Flp pilus assembly pilin Flp
MGWASADSITVTPLLQSANSNKATTMNRIAGKLKDFAANDVGSAAVEYAVIAVIITTSLISVVANFSTVMTGVFEYIGQQMNDATATAN